MLDPAPAGDFPDKVLDMADLITPNETELSLLTGLPVYDLPSAQRAAKRLLRRGAHIVLAKLGARGALVVNDQDAVHVPPMRVVTADTTAAGDTFNGGLVAALGRGSDLIEAARWANAAAALSTTQLGAQISIPTAAETDAFFATNPNRAVAI